MYKKLWCYPTAKVNVNFPIHLSTAPIRTYGRVEVKLHAFYTWKLDGGG